jgi:Uma2 family endonuclease
MAGAPAQRFVRASELLDHLGGIPPSRVRLLPPPGTAKEKDLLRVLDHEDCVAELIDGTIVEKPMVMRDSMLAVELSYHLKLYLRQHDLGAITGPAGLLRLEAGKVRAPDVGFIRWKQMPGKVYPSQPIASLYPDLAVEILSPSNTRREMERKLLDYFKSGTELVWIIDPDSRTAEVHAGSAEPVLLDESGALDGGSVLPGFRLALRELFAKLGPAPRKPRKNRPPKGGDRG